MSRRLEPHMDTQCRGDTAVRLPTPHAGDIFELAAVLTISGYLLCKRAEWVRI